MALASSVFNFSILFSKPLATAAISSFDLSNLFVVIRSAPSASLNLASAFFISFCILCIAFATIFLFLSSSFLSAVWLLPSLFIFSAMFNSFCLSSSNSRFLFSTSSSPSWVPWFFICGLLLPFTFGFVPFNISLSSPLTLFNVMVLFFMYLFLNPAFLILVWMFLYLLFAINPSNIFSLFFNSISLSSLVSSPFIALYLLFFRTSSLKAFKGWRLLNRTLTWSSLFRSCSLRLWRSYISRLVDSEPFFLNSWKRSLARLLIALFLMPFTLFPTSVIRFSNPRVPNCRASILLWSFEIFFFGMFNVTYSPFL